MERKLDVQAKMPIQNHDDLSIAYTPGVAAPCLEIQKIQKAYILIQEKEIQWP